MKRILFALPLMAAVTAGHAQSFNQFQLTTATPAVLQVRDRGNQWIPIGTINSATHAFGLTVATSTVTGLGTFGSANISGLGTFGTANVSGLATLGSASITGAATMAGTVDATGTIKVNGGATASRPVIWGVDTGSAPYTLVPFNFTSTENTVVGSNAQRFTMNVASTKALTGSGDGSRTALVAQQTGGNFLDPTYFAVGAELAAIATAGAGNNGGTWTGANPLCSLPVGMNAATVACWSVEADVFMDSPGVGKIGVGVADLRANGHGSIYDSAFAAFKSGAGIGFDNGLLFGLSVSAQFPVRVGGTLINSVASDVNLRAGVDFSAITTFTEAALKFKAGGSNADFIWGTAGAGGKISSQTTTGAGGIVFASGLTTLQMPHGTNVFQAEANRVFATVPLRLAAYTVATLPACGASLTNAIAAVSDATAPTYNASLTGGGAVNIPVFCDGAAWKAH